MNNKDRAEIVREKLRQKELKNPSGSSQGRNLSDLTGGLSWKATGIIILLLIARSLYYLLKSNPPIVISTIASSDDRQSVVAGIGNEGFRDIQLLDVTVNDGVEPSEAMLQVSNAEQGLIVTDNFMSEEVKDFGFTRLDMVTIKSGTPAYPNLEESNQGIPLEDLPLFGVSVIHDEPIDRIDIEYRHFGMKYEHTVYFD